MIKKFLENRRIKKYEKNLNETVGKNVLNNIKNVIKEDILKWFSLSNEKDFDEFMVDYWSYEWVDFLERNHLELCYEVEPVYEKGKLVDVSIDIFEP